MKFHTEYLTVNTTKPREYINITSDVDKALTKSGILQDFDAWLEKLAPFNPDYNHHWTGETNWDAHLKSILVHHEVIVPVTKGKLDFGPWQQVYYAEFDGQRPKRIIIKVMGE